jgi:glucan phosphoethanolaminetransferase (alkaline phosphatase superfamily)
MATRSEDQHGHKTSRINWRAWVFAGLALAVALLVAYFLLAMFVPRWWAQRIADMSGHGSFAKGISSGLLLGVVCTAVPLLLLLLTVLTWRRRAGRFLAGAAAVVAVIVAAPNLMTLTIVLGASNAAHAGERVLDVDAPGFRGATLIGAIVAGVISLLVTVLAVLRRRRRSRRERQHADV